VVRPLLKQLTGRETGAVFTWCGVKLLIRLFVLAEYEGVKVSFLDVETVVLRLITRDALGFKVLSRPSLVDSSIRDDLFSGSLNKGMFEVQGSMLEALQG